MERVLTYSRTIRDYIILTKPGIVAMSVMTAMTGIYISYRGIPDPVLLLWTLLGIGLAASGATVLNNFYDRDIDVIMRRTCSRPLPSGRIKPSTALASGITVVIVSLLILFHFVNSLSALLAMAAVFIYVVIYTSLKRKTPNATVIGGISGALPPVIGCAAVSGTITKEALILFLIMFIWQPSHFWFLAIKYAEDYRNASIPIMPVAKGISRTKMKILLFNIVLFPASILPYLYGITGKVYLITAYILGIAYILFSVRLLFLKGEKNVIRFFYFSILYLLILFGVMGANMLPL
jgi:protoheme IX farnesyltransferase